MLGMDSRKCQKQQEERACKQRFVLLPLWYDKMGIRHIA